MICPLCVLPIAYQELPRLSQTATSRIANASPSSDISKSSAPPSSTPIEEIIFQNQLYRVIWVNDTPTHPLFLRAIWQAHVKEMTDLDENDQLLLLKIVRVLEVCLKEIPVPYTPDKINLASLGNMVPHLHWHVIARYHDDTQWPAPIWGSVQREPTSHKLQTLKNIRPVIQEKILYGLNLI